MEGHKAKGYRGWELEDIKRIPLRDVASAMGVDLKPGSARCPLPEHTDHTPSFLYWERTNSWKCFGCGRGGSAIDLVMNMQGWDFKKAVMFLNKSFFEKGIYNDNTFKIRSLKPSEIIHREKADPEVYKFILNRLVLTDRIKKYFKKRAISEQTVRKFKIGEIIDSTDISKLLINHFGYERSNKAGLLSKNSSQKNPQLINFKDKAIFPFMQGNECVYFQGRTIGAKTKASRWLNLYNISTPIYNFNALTDRTIKSLHVCEGITDALSAEEMGFSAVGILGATKSLPPDILSFFSGRDVYILGDSDKQGFCFAEKIRSQLIAIGVSPIIQEFGPNVQDLNDYLIKNYLKI